MGVAIYDLLGGARVLGASPRSNADWIARTRAGLPREAARELGRQLDPNGTAFPVQQDDHGFGSMLTSFSREGNQLSCLLTPTESDVVVRMANVFSRAIEVLETPEKASHWLMNSPNDALGGAVPASVLDTSTGEREVLAVLDRIEYGVYS